MLSILLYPFSILYGLVVRGRNFLYDHGIKKSYSFDCAVITVGNLSVGGTGKTPMIEYLATLLQNEYSLAILSRGYGRKTRGFILAEMHDDDATIGDEPFQFYRKYGGQLSVAVCESRVEGITKLLNKKPGIQVILLDDAFQHRAVKPLLSILLTEYSRPFFKDHLLPMGRLREPRNESIRADVLVVTKCNDLSNEVELDYVKFLQLHAGVKPIFFSNIIYKTPISLDGLSRIFKNVILVTGIANSKTLVHYVSSKFTLINHFQFNDHYRYSSQDVEMIQGQSSMDTFILTTEKDMVKLISVHLEKSINKKLWFYLPIETHFLKNGSEFDMLVTEKIKSHLKLHP